MNSMSQTYKGKYLYFLLKKHNKKIKIIDWSASLPLSAQHHNSHLSVSLQISSPTPEKKIESKKKEPTKIWYRFHLQSVFGAALWVPDSCTHRHYLSPSLAGFLPKVRNSRKGKEKTEKSKSWFHRDFVAAPAVMRADFWHFSKWEVIIMPEWVMV